jgi:hypothetical protein
MDRFSIALKKKPPASKPKIETEWTRYTELLLDSDKRAFHIAHRGTSLNNIKALRDLKQLLLKANGIDTLYHNSRVLAIEAIEARICKIEDEERKAALIDSYRGMGIDPRLTGRPLRLF